MKQIEIFEITSPCIGVCQSGPKGFCVGCFRSRDERVHWINLEQDVQSKIIKACAARKKRALKSVRTKAPAATPIQQFDFFNAPPKT